MSTLKVLDGHLRLPIICSPLFIVSYPELVLAQCKAGIVGSFPALNARKEGELDEWLTRMADELAEYQAANPGEKVAPFAVNQIVHSTNTRLSKDLEVCLKHKVMLTISSLRPPSKEVIDEAHSYGGMVIHDVINKRHAMKALEAGVDGLVLVANGAGGHAGQINPIALVSEIRREFKGPLILSGAISTGDGVLAALAMGADYAYMGTRFVATKEGNAVEAYKQTITEASASDVVYTNLFSGVHGNYLRQSIEQSGLDPDNLPEGNKSTMAFDKATATGSSKPKVWKDIWGAGQGVGAIDSIPAVADLVDKLESEFNAAKARLQLVA